MIIPSLLDIDLYKLTMMQFVWRMHKDVKVRYDFINRTDDVRLAEYVSPYAVAIQTTNTQSLRFTFEELTWLGTLGLFDKDFIWDCLAFYQLPLISISGDKETGQLSISTEGPWYKTILWETLVLSIVSELYNVAKTKENGLKTFIPTSEGINRLMCKRDWLKDTHTPIVDFGTRRRYSHYWQGLLLTLLQRDIPDLLTGTSNLWFARELGLQPIGTYAHELEMVYGGIYPHETKDDYISLHQRLMNDWFNMYGERLAIALTDTFGSKFFWEATSDWDLKRYRGVRQDSGDPDSFTIKAGQQYEESGIQTWGANPKKVIVYSDGLDVPNSIRLHRTYESAFNVVAAIGTNLTNDCGNRPLSIVMKATMANGVPLVKLSDNLAKAIGTREEVERVSKLLGSGIEENTPCLS